jgi:hypothetical protein
MTFKELKKKYSISQQEEDVLTSSQNQINQAKLSLLLTKLRGKPFWIKDPEVHREEYIRSKEDENYCCCFWHQFQPNARGSI